MNTTTRPLRTAAHLQTLKLRLASQKGELAGCTTDAMRRCVEESIADTERQLLDAQTPAEVRRDLFTFA